MLLRQRLSNVNILRNLPGMQNYEIPTRHQSTTPGCGETDTDVNFSAAGGKALIALNRPKQLNALNQSMARKIYSQLYSWKDNKNLIVIKGTGDKAFCAGGDVVAITRDTSGSSARAFFKDEYRMNALIGSLNVPYVAFISGIVMGGGVGLSVHGKYRVATEKTLFAMPETQIGLFPDVGASYVLSRMPNRLGYFLGLTGYRLKGYDVVHANIATHYCHSSKLGILEKKLLCSPSECPDVEKTLCDMQNESLKDFNGVPPPFSLCEHIPIIDKCFTSRCAERIIQKLKAENSPFAKQIAESLTKMSPTSLKLTISLIERAECLDLNECLNMEYRVACHVSCQTEFYEGVRALLVDKDKNPKWNPSTLNEVTPEYIESFFCRLSPTEELNLPCSLQNPCPS